MNTPNYDLLGYALAMRVMQSDLYDRLDDTERAQCDELIQQGMGIDHLVDDSARRDFERAIYAENSD